jgi:hypothetical protein
MSMIAKWWCLFFLNKNKAGALSYHLRRSKGTSRAEATTTTTTTTHVYNAPNKTLHHLNLEEKLKEVTKSRAVVANVVPRQKSRPAASLSDNPDSSATRKTTLSRTRTTADPGSTPGSSLASE